MDALLRRLEALKRDELRIDSRPAGGAVLGAYTTRRRGSGARPYQTVLSAVDPIEARCDCPDFLKNSLGICKHVLIVLEHLHARPRLLQQALKEQESLRGPCPGPALGPDPPLDRRRRLARPRRLGPPRPSRTGARRTDGSRPGSGSGAETTGSWS